MPRWEIKLRAITLHASPQPSTIDWPDEVKWSWKMKP